jgi:hypothetical protein
MNPFLRRNWFMVKNQLAAMVTTVGIEESERSMVGASKILTVSYGTFSCTLEGFDEPFSTMKAIAEYFRDLAADDRYFGAEPPTPDTEMLHRIAEREAHRRVEARIGAHGITLRPKGEDVPAAGKALTDTAVDSQATAPPAEPAPDLSAMPPMMPEFESIEDSVAAKLARIRAAVAGARAAAAQPAYDDEAEADATPAAISDQNFGFDIDLGGPLQSEPEADAAPTGTDETAASAQPLPHPKAEPEPETIASVAEATTEVREALAEPAAVAAVATETTKARRGAARRAARNAAALAALTSAAAPFIAATPEAEAPQGRDTEPEPQPIEWLDEPIAEADEFKRTALPEATTEAIAEAAGDAEPSQTAEVDSDQPAPETATPEVAEADAGTDETGIAETFAMLAAEADGSAVPEATEAEPPEAAAEALPESPVADDIWDDAEPVSAAPAEAARVRARVIKVRRADAPAAESAPTDIAEAAAEVMNDTDTLAAVSAALAEPEIPAPEAALLSPEEEAALARELAELEAELAPPSSDDLDMDFDSDEDEGLHLALGSTAAIPEAEIVEPVAPVEARPAAPAQRPRDAAAAEPAEANLSRLLDETNTKLEGPENRRRFSAIAHLKAAVAATVADRKLRSPDEAAAAEAEDARDLERYREDLTKAVRPRRPIPGAEAATQRPAVPEQRPAPLVLVSEQRIDRPRNAAVAEPNVIRPRRISVAQVATAALPDADDEEDFDGPPMTLSEARSFAEFAESLGARELPELLEAAAAYTARIEGQPHFSRPQIIRKVAALAEDAGYNREAGLRSFGTLLRQGKIAKVRRGQFAITEASRFYPRAAGSR